MYRYCILFFLSIISLFNVEFASAQTIRSEDFYSGEKDATPAFVSMIHTLKQQGGGELLIKEDTYHFYPDKAFETFCYISNHDDGLRSTPFPIIDMNNVNIVGDNVRFIFHGIMLPFIIEDSHNISISGISIDWEHTFHSEMEVVANNAEGGTFDVRITSDYPYTIRNGELIFIKEGYEHNLERAILWDIKTKAVAYNTVKSTPFEPFSAPTIKRYEEKIVFPYPIVEREAIHRFRYVENKVNAKELKPGLVRLSGTGRQVPGTGMVIVCKGRNGLNRIAPAFRVLNARHTTLKNINVYHAGGMGLIVEKSEDIYLDNFNIKLPDNSNRMLSTTADATHFVNCKGRIEMKNCVFSNQLDDATNIHGTFVEVVDRINDKCIGVKLGHFQQLGFEFASVGDKIGFVDAHNSYEPFETNVVKRVTPVNKRYYIVEFDTPLSDNVQNGIVLDNIEWYPEVLISNCKALNNRARGFLISTPKTTVIENCTFSNMMAAIFLPTELSWWYESGCAADLTIRNNVFNDCCYGGNKTAVIACHTNHDLTGYVYKNIVIENNRFSTFDKALLKMEKVDGLVFKNNTISPSSTYKPLFGKQAAINITHSKKIVIESNTCENENWFGINLDKETQETAKVQ